MRLLVDTHVFLWMQTDPERIRDGARASIVSGANEVLLSVASIWEMAIKVRLGRLPLPEPIDRYVETACARASVSVLPVAASAAYEVARLPHHHRDPFDRILIAQARMEKLRLVTHDRAFRKYDVDLVRA